jgi:hypothetical protein
MTTLQLAAFRSGPHPRWLAATLLIAAAAGALIYEALQEPIQQSEAYHHFVDRRPFAGIPNAANVLSNVGFLAAGALGLRAVRRRRGAFLDARERAPWIALFAGTLLVSAGSAAYHLDPSNASLVLDRLPMTVGFMGFLAAMIAERVDVRAGARLLAPLLAIGAVTAVSWWWTTPCGTGDLRPYYFVQAFSLAAVPLLLLASAPRYTGTAWIVGGLGLYGAAKLAELWDEPIFAATGGVVSGHTLKHLLATAGIALLVILIERRRPWPAPAGGGEG